MSKIAYIKKSDRTVKTQKQFISETNQAKKYTNEISKKLIVAVNELNDFANELSKKDHTIYSDYETREKTYTYKNKQNDEIVNSKKYVEFKNRFNITSNEIIESENYNSKLSNVFYSANYKNNNAYDIIDKFNKQALNLKLCSNRIYVENYEHKNDSADKKNKVVPFSTCKNKFCSICAVYRSRRLFKDTYEVVENIKSQGIDFVAYHLTLTIKNPVFEQFEHYYNVMNEAFVDMFDLSKKNKNYKLKNYVLGYQAAREVSQSEAAKERSELHPHMHILLLLKPEFLRKNRSQAMTKNEILAEWNRALKMQDANFQDVSQIEFVKVKDESNAICEVSKYPIKPSDVLKMDSWDLLWLMIYLTGKRMVTFGGIVKDTRKLLKMIDDSNEDGFINESDYKLKSAKCYNFINNNYKVQNTRKQELLEYLAVSSGLVLELKYCKTDNDKKNVIDNYGNLAIAYENNNTSFLDNFVDLSNYQEYENIKTSDAAAFYEKLKDVATEIISKVDNYKKYKMLLKIINSYIYLYSCLLNC